MPELSYREAVRDALVPAPAYTPEARDAFYATLAQLAALLAAQDLIVLVAATVHRAGKETGVYVGRKKRQGDDPDSILDNYHGDNSGDQH